MLFRSVTITRNWTFSNKMTELTTLVAHLLEAGFVVLPPPLLEDLVEALDDERLLLIVELGGVNGELPRSESSGSAPRRLRNQRLLPVLHQPWFLLRILKL